MVVAVGSRALISGIDLKILIQDFLKTAVYAQLLGYVPGVYLFVSQVI